MIDYKDQEKQLKIHIATAQDILWALQHGLYSKPEADKAIQVARWFHVEYLGGPPEQNKMADLLWAIVFQVSVICNS